MGICYAGLQIGFGIVGSTVAAVIGFGLLRGVLRSFAPRAGSILEVNVFQTVASGVNTVNAGVIFTVPVLYLFVHKGTLAPDSIRFVPLVIATMAGSILGVVMIIPLRKQIIDFERLRFPEGVATAAILRSPGAGVQKAILLVGGIIVSVIVTTIAINVGGKMPVGDWIGLPAGFRFVFAVSLLSLGAGYLAGRPGLVVLYGTLLNFWVLIPACVYLGWVPVDANDANLWANWTPFDSASDDFAGAAAFKKADKFFGAFSQFTSRNVGIGMILGGAIAGIMVALPALRAALASLRSPKTIGPREEMPVSVLNTGLVIGFGLLLVAAKVSGGDDVTWGKAILAAAVGGFWLWLAGLVVAQTTGRTDWSPLSGLSLIAIAIMMAIFGTREVFIVPAVTLGAAICVATSMCADMMADLKTGYLVGARPIRQQFAQIATCWIGPAITLAIVFVLWQSYAFGPDQAQILWERAQATPEALAAYQDAGGTETTLARGYPELKAPQAGALEGAIEIMRGGDVPLGKYIAGAILGIVVSLLVSPGMGVMVGLSLYLPFEYMIVFGLGGIVNIIVTKVKGPRFAEDKGVPIAAGLIVGDALVGVSHALWKVATSL